MKRTIFVLILSLALTTGSSQDWLRLLSGTYKIGKALTITDEELADAVEESVRAMDNSNTVCASNSEYTRRLKRITKGMTDAEGIPLNFKVYRTEELNAFACPDGSVRVYSGLMDQLTDDELLGVIGHEIGHIALRHSKKAWQEELMRSAASDAVGAFSDIWAGLSNSAIGNITGAAISAKHSRVQENQADDYGYEFLKKCNKNPWAMGLAFKKIKQLTGSNDSRYSTLMQAFSSHPDFDERIERMRRKAREDGYPCR